MLAPPKKENEIARTHRRNQKINFEGTSLNISRLICTV